jgi:HlyD family secretion protein
MKKLLTITALTGIVVAICLGAASDAPKSEERPAISATKEGVGALGRIEPCSEVRKIHAPSSMDVPVIAELRVAVGQPVAQGEILAVLDSHARELADVEQARASLLSSEKALAQVRAGAKAGDIAAQESLVEQTRERLRFAEEQLDRAQKLVARKALSADELDRHESDVDVLRKQLKQHEFTLAAIREVRMVDVEHAESEVLRSRATLKRAEADLAITEIRSPIHGEVLQINSREGERIGDDGLLQLGDTRQMHVVAEVHEADILRVKLNQKATVYLRNLDRTLQGTVVEVGRLIGRKDVLSNDPVDDTDARVVEVRIALNEEDSKPVSGLSFGKVEVTVHTPDDAAETSSVEFTDSTSEQPSSISPVATRGDRQ